MTEIQHPKHPEQHEPSAILPAGKGRSRRRRRLAAGAAAAALLVAGSSGTALAASNGTPPSGAGGAGGLGGGGFSVSGTLVSVGKASLGFKLTDGTVATATLGSSTIYTKTATVKVAALTNGETVSVTGKTSGGVLAATRITVSQAGATGGFGGLGGAGARHQGSYSHGAFPEGATGGARAGNGFGAGGFTLPTFGTVSGISAGSFTLTEANKTKVKVTTTSSTVVTQTVKIAKSGLSVGQTLLIRGTEKSNTVVAATSVSEGNAGFGAFGGGGAGGGPGGGGGASPGAAAAA